MRLMLIYKNTCTKPFINSFPAEYSLDQQEPDPAELRSHRYIDAPAKPCGIASFYRAVRRSDQSNDSDCALYDFSTLADMIAGV